MSRLTRWVPLLAVLARAGAGAVAWGTAVTPVLAQSVLLQIRPRVGDTLSMRLDQQTEMIGVRKTGNKESSGSVITMMSMFSRAIVEQGSATGSTVLTVTDSVHLSTS